MSDPDQALWDLRATTELVEAGALGTVFLVCPACGGFLGRADVEEGSERVRAVCPGRGCWVWEVELIGKCRGARTVLVVHYSRLRRQGGGR